MLLYAQDAMTTETPWELWEYSKVSAPFSGNDLATNPGWKEWMSYRRKTPKQKYITIGNMEVPEPMREAPAIGSRYYCGRYPLTGLDCSGDAWGCQWANDGVDCVRLRQGMCHSTMEAARQHSVALHKLNNQEGH